jgi:hypothetical protein
MNCPRCDSTNIEKGVSIRKSAETGNVGPKFSNGIFTGVAQMYCDMLELWRDNTVLHKGRYL